MTPNPVKPERDFQLDASSSSDPDGSVVHYEWDLDNDGTYELSTGANPITQHEGFSSPGDRTIGLRVSDDGGATAETTRVVAVQHAAGASVSPARVALRLQRKSDSFELAVSASEVDGGTPILNGEQLLVLGATGRGRAPARGVPAPLRDGRRRIRWAERADVSQDLTGDLVEFNGFALLRFPAGGLACVAFRGRYGSTV